MWINEHKLHMQKKLINEKSGEIDHLVVCKVGKEETKATHLPHSCRGQQHSRSECYPKLIKTNVRHHIRD